MAALSWHIASELWARTMKGGKKINEASVGMYACIQVLLDMPASSPR